MFCFWQSVESICSHLLDTKHQASWLELSPTDRKSAAAHMIYTLQKNAMLYGESVHERFHDYVRIHSHLCKYLLFMINLYCWFGHHFAFSLHSISLFEMSAKLNSFRSLAHTTHSIACQSWLVTLDVLFRPASFRLFDHFGQFDAALQLVHRPLISMYALCAQQSARVHVPTVLIIQTLFSCKARQRPSKLSWITIHNHIGKNRANDVIAACSVRPHSVRLSGPCTPNPFGQHSGHCSSRQMSANCLRSTRSNSWCAFVAPANVCCNRSQWHALNCSAKSGTWTFFFSTKCVLKVFRFVVVRRSSRTFVSSQI